MRGNNGNGETSVPALPSGLTYVEVAAGWNHTVARRSGGVGSASVASVGSGSGGAGIPTLSSNPPRIGQNLGFSLSQGTPNVSGFLFFSGGPPILTPVGAGAVVVVDLATIGTLLPVVPNAGWIWSSTVPVPLDPSLIGAQAAVQGALFSTSGPLGLDISTGLAVTIGY